MGINAEELDAVCDLVNDLCGVYLDDKKAYLIESRLSPIVKSAGCENYLSLVNQIRRTRDLGLTNQVIDAITTNETLFFRDQSPFEALQHKVLPELIDSKASGVFPTRIRVWSAACSTGQEAYSIAMTFCELLPDVENWNIQILGTDVSDAAVAKASRGLYGRLEMERGVAPKHLKKYFQPEGDGWLVSDQLRSMVQFQKKNLLEPLHMPSRFDVILCRNVAIYFEPDVRRNLFHRLIETLTPGGYLFVGSQESLIDLGPQFKPQHHCRATLYRPNLKPDVAAI